MFTNDTFAAFVTDLVQIGFKFQTRELNTKSQNKKYTRINEIVPKISGCLECVNISNLLFQSEKLILHA